MNSHLTYLVAQAHVAELIRHAERHANPGGPIEAKALHDAFSAAPSEMCKAFGASAGEHSVTHANAHGGVVR
jgi:hypothetical protein